MGRGLVQNAAAGDDVTRRDVRVAGVVLAAGRATRMAGSKVVRLVGGKPMVARVVEAVLGSRLVDPVVVVGHEAEQVCAILHDQPVRIVHNPRYAEGMSTSLRAGLGDVGPRHDGAMFVLADQPFVTSALIDRLLEAFATSGKPIVRPRLHGSQGNPVLFSHSLFPELMREQGDRGGRQVILRHQGDVCFVEVDDPMLCLDVDSLEEYERLEK